MPIFTNPTTPIQTERPTENRTPGPYKSIQVDSKLEAPSTLLVNMDGSPWTIAYYRQILGSDNATQGLQTTLDSIYQQYEHIRQLEIRVQSPLSVSANIQTKEMDVVGVARLYPGIIPNEGDMFVADIGDGRRGLFEISSVNQLTYLKHSVYEIEYGLRDFMNAEYDTQLKEKTIKTSIFIKSPYSEHGFAILGEADYEAWIDGINAIVRLSDKVYQKFYNKEFSCFLIPSQPTSVYDPCWSRYLKTIIDQFENRWINTVRHLNCQTGTDTNIVTLWDVLVEHDPFMLSIVAEKFELVSYRSFNSRPDAKSIYFSGINQVYNPAGIKYDSGKSTYSGSCCDDASGMLTPSDAVTFRARQARAIERGDLDSDLSKFIKPVTIDDYYVFSAAYYADDTDDMSVLEAMTRAMLKAEQVDIVTLVAMVDQSQIWGDLEQFYYYPVMITLLHYAVRNRT